MCLIKREPFRLYIIKYLFQTGTNSACGFGAWEPIWYQPTGQLLVARFSFIIAIPMPLFCFEDVREEFIIV
jgi:hypothetical protein